MEGKSLAQAGGGSRAPTARSQPANQVGCFRGQKLPSSRKEEGDTKPLSRLLAGGEGGRHLARGGASRTTLQHVHFHVRESVSEKRTRGNQGGRWSDEGRGLLSVARLPVPRLPQHRNGAPILKRLVNQPRTCYGMRVTKPPCCQPSLPSLLGARTFQPWKISQSLGRCPLIRMRERGLLPGLPTAGTTLPPL